MSIILIILVIDKMIKYVLKFIFNNLVGVASFLSASAAIAAVLIGRINNSDNNYINSIVKNRVNRFNKFVKIYGELMALCNQCFNLKQWDPKAEDHYNSLLKKIEIDLYQLQLNIDTSLKDVYVLVYFNSDKATNKGIISKEYVYHYLMLLMEAYCKSINDHVACIKNDYMKLWGKNGQKIISSIDKDVRTYKQELINNIFVYYLFENKLTNYDLKHSHFFIKKKNKNKSEIKNEIYLEAIKEFKKIFKFY